MPLALAECRMHVGAPLARTGGEEANTLVMVVMVSLCSHPKCPPSLTSRRGGSTWPFTSAHHPPDGFASQSGVEALRERYALVCRHLASLDCYRVVMVEVLLRSFGICSTSLLSQHFAQPGRPAFSPTLLMRWRW